MGYIHRAEFYDLVLDTLEKMIGGGALGACILFLSYAFRNESDKEICGGR